MFSIIQAAGWPIWPLILCSVVALALVIERFVNLRPVRIAPPKLLAELDFFRPFGPTERQAIADAATEHRFGLGESICVEGREGDTFYVVVSGRVSVRVGQPAREVATISRGHDVTRNSAINARPRNKSC